MPNNNLTFDNFSFINRKRCDEVFWPLDSKPPLHLFALAKGEMLDELELEVAPPYPKEIDVVAVGKEIADVVTYLDLLATRLGLSLGDIVAQKFNEVSDRKQSRIKIPI